MPLRRSSLASVNASASSAAFAMLYGDEFAAMCDVAALEIITMSPRSRVAHRRDEVLAQHERAERVRAEQPLDLGGSVSATSAAARRDARVVHEDVDRAEVVEHASRAIAAHCVDVVDRRRERDRAPAERLDLGDGRGGRRPRPCGS